MSTALIIEDCLSDQELLSGCLLQGGLNVLRAINAEDAVAKISRHKPDVIILDVVLPDRSGFELCRELKGQAETSKIPIVICSTKGGKLNQRWGLNFLDHSLYFFLVFIPLLIAAILLISRLSYRYIELPFLIRKARI